jgi:methylmalonyl-CoA/ethylmalonyl-CoA epimerase
MKFLFDAGNMAFYQCGDVRLMIGAGAANSSRGGTIIYFLVSDLEAVHAHLVERSVVFVQAPHLVAKMPDHDLWLALFNDPDANVIGLLCEKRRG